MGIGLKGFLKKQVLAKVDFLDPNYRSKPTLYHGATEANLITSLANDINSEGMQLHRLILDVDRIDVIVEESSTPGNYHVAFDKVLTYDQWIVLMQAFLYAGIIEPGWYRSAMSRGYATLRVPWVKKDSSLGVDNRPRRVVY